MVKIYFACSIRGGRDDIEIYKQLVRGIRKHGQVLSEIFAEDKLTDMGSPGPTKKTWENDISMLKDADIVIAEVTNPSLGVGYEIAKAEEWGKPVLALFRKSAGRSLSAMIDGSPGTKVVHYTTLVEAIEIAQRFIESRSV